MERLSNIMRTGQGSPLTGQQRVSQQQGQRQPARRPLAEQQGRQPAPRQSSGLYRSRPAPTPRVPTTHNEVWEEPEQPPARSTRANYAAPRMPYIPPSSRYSELPPQGDYYPEDERTTIVPADAQEEWNDDTAGMRYGDWESAPGYHHAPAYEDEEEFELPISQPQHEENEEFGLSPYPPSNTNPAQRSSAQEMTPAAKRIRQFHALNTPRATREIYSMKPESSLPATPRTAHEIPEARLPMQTTGDQRSLIQPKPYSQQRTTQPLQPTKMAQLHAEMQQRLPAKTSHKENNSPTVYVPAPYKNPAAVCPMCKGAGYLRQDVPYGHPGFGKPVQCECKRKELQNKRLQKIQEASNLRNLNDKHFSNFIVNNAHIQLREAYEIAKEYARDPNGWLVFMGRPGCGKTHLAAAIANQYLKTGETVFFITVSDLLDHLRTAFNPSSEATYDELFSRVRESALLVLDDLGSQKSSPWANEKLFQLINYRYNYRVPTVITTNLTSHQGPAQVVIDDRIRSRMNDFSFVTLINLDRVRDYRPNNPRRDDFV